jgi:hypothetical protein
VRVAGSRAWTGDADTLVFWGERTVEVGTLGPLDEFELFNLRWRVNRKARRTTLADAVQPDWKGCRIQLKHSRLVDVPVIVRADSNTESKP